MGLFVQERKDASPTLRQKCGKEVDEGRWGSPVELSLRERLVPRVPLVRTLLKVFQRPIREAGPTGPNTRPGLCWNRPLDWVNLECLDAAKTSDWIGNISGASTNEL